VEEDIQFENDGETDKEFDKIAESDIILEKIDEFSKDIDFDKHTDEVTIKTYDKAICITALNTWCFVLCFLSFTYLFFLPFRKRKVKCVEFPFLLIV